MTRPLDRLALLLALHGRGVPEGRRATTVFVALLGLLAAARAS